MRRKLMQRAWQGSLLLILILFSHGSLAEPAKRVISIDGSITEIIYALDQQHRLVGRDATSTWPEAAQDLPDIGYMRQLSAEGILSLRPDLILVTADAQPQSVLDQLQRARIDIQVIPNAYTLEGVEEKIIQVARALSVEERGIVLAHETTEQTRLLTNSLQQLQQTPLNAVFIMSVRNSNMMVAGRGSRADALMQLAGIHNPFSDKVVNYQNVSGEALMEANPDLIITLQDMAMPNSGVERLLQDPAISRTEAAQKGQVIAIQARWLNFGPDLPVSLDALVKQLNSVKPSRSNDQLNANQQDDKPTLVSVNQGDF